MITLGGENIDMYSGNEQCQSVEILNDKLISAFLPLLVLNKRSHCRCYFTSNLKQM